MATILPPPKARVIHDPDAELISCAICGAKIPRGDSYSIQMTFATNGPGFVSPSGRNPQCDEEQHFGCSEAHAVQAAHACLDEHLAPKHRALRAAMQPANKPKPVKKG